MKAEAAVAGVLIQQEGHQGHQVGKGRGGGRETSSGISDGKTGEAGEGKGNGRHGGGEGRHGGGDGGNQASERHQGGARRGGGRNGLPARVAQTYQQHGRGQ
eukprot:113105-Heterocapsa_arctica.AAC.1